MILLLAALAFAADAEPPLAIPAVDVESAEAVEPVPLAQPVDPSSVIDDLRQREDAHSDDEIIVYGELLVERARQKVIKELKAEGYTDARDKGDHLVLRHVEPWKGEVHLYDDGWIRMKRQKIRIEGREMPWARRNSPLAWASCALLPFACLRTGGALVSGNKFMSQKVRTLGVVSPDVRDLGDRVADLATERRVESLPDQLEALWQHGRPFEGEAEALVTMELRRAAILAFWESRTDTIWGNRVRAAVEAFIREEVQYSDHAFTPEEIAAFNVRRTCERELDLDRPWRDLIADLKGQ